MISSSSSMASSQPATSANVVFGMSLVISLALDLPNCMTPRPPPPCIWFISQRKTRTIRRRIGSRETDERAEQARLGDLGRSTSRSCPSSTCVCTASTMLVLLVRRRQCVVTLRPPSRSTLSSSVALICLVAVDEGDLLDLAVGDVARSSPRCSTSSYPPPERRGLQGEEHADHGDDDPEPGTLEDALHGLLSSCATHA